METKIIVDETVSQQDERLAGEAISCLDVLAADVAQIRQSILDGRTPESLLNSIVTPAIDAVEEVGRLRFECENMENSRYKIGDQVTVDGQPATVIHTDYLPSNPYIVRFTDGVEETFSENDLDG